jgi:hypothetical protein
VIPGPKAADISAMRKRLAECETQIGIAFERQDAGLMARLHRLHNQIIGDMLAIVNGSTVR